MTFTPSQGLTSTGGSHQRLSTVGMPRQAHSWERKGALMSDTENHTVPVRLTQTCLPDHPLHTHTPGPVPLAPPTLAPAAQRTQSNTDTNCFDLFWSMQSIFKLSELSAEWQCYFEFYYFSEIKKKSQQHWGNELTGTSIEAFAMYKPFPEGKRLTITASESGQACKSSYDNQCQTTKILESWSDMSKVTIITKTEPGSVLIAF